MRSQFNDTVPPSPASPALDLPFTIEELNAAISDVGKRYYPAFDEITYEAISHLSKHSGIRLIEYYNRA